MTSQAALLKGHTHTKIRAAVNMQCLARNLSLQPWVMQVKVISTATIPLIKIHADPSAL